MFPFCIGLPGRSKGLINPLSLEHVLLWVLWLIPGHCHSTGCGLKPPSAPRMPFLLHWHLLSSPTSWVFFLWLCSVWDGSSGRCALSGWVGSASFRTLCSPVLTGSGLGHVSDPLPTFPHRGPELFSPRQVFAWCCITHQLGTPFLSVCSRLTLIWLVLWIYNSSVFL